MCQYDQQHVIRWLKECKSFNPLPLMDCHGCAPYLSQVQSRECIALVQGTWRRGFPDKMKHVSGFQSHLKHGRAPSRPLQAEESIAERRRTSVERRGTYAA